MRRLFLLVAMFFLAGCTATHPVAAPPKASMEFLDLQRFDQELGASLHAPLSRVDVTFYDRVTPSALPPRLQRWMSAVEDGGGKLSVIPPPGSVSAKSPFLLIGAVSAIWSGQKMAREVAADAGLRAARGYDAQLVLKQDERGDVLVERVVFVQRVH